MFRRRLDGCRDGERAEVVVNTRRTGIASVEVVQDCPQQQPYVVHERFLHRQRHVFHRFRAIMDDMEAIEECGLTNAPRAQSVRQRKESRAVRADQVPVYWTVIPFASVNVAQTVVSSAYSLHGGLLVVADTVITSES